MAVSRVHRRLAAILVIDVVGYSRLMSIDEVGTLTRLKRLQSELWDPMTERFGGRIVKTTGDGAIIEFGSAVDAVAYAVGVQQGMAERNAGVGLAEGLVARVGVNVGDVIVEGDDVFGNGINIAARLEPLAEPGGICVSDRVRDYVSGTLDIDFRDLRVRELKNIAEPVRVFSVEPRSAKQHTPLASGVRQPQITDVAQSKPSIAVLPFENRSSDPEQDYFSDGMAEDLITDLSKIASLAVASRNSSFSFKGGTPTASEVADKLGVQLVLGGSVRKMGDRLRINAELVDTADGTRLWAERYDGELGEVFEFQDRIRDQIISALKLTLTPKELEQTARTKTHSIEAYDLYLRGRTLYFSFQPDDNTEAGHLFSRAIELDSDFVEAYTYLTMCVIAAWLFMWPGFEEGLERAVELGDRAVEIAPDSNVAHLRLGWVQLFQRKHETALASFEHALALNPDDAETHAYFAETLSYAGDYKRANAHATRALRLDPLAPPSWQFHYGRTLYHLGQLDEAASTIRAVVERVPEMVIARLFLACIYVETDRPDEAREQIRHVTRQEPRYTLQVVDRVYPFRLDHDREQFLTSLRSAGLPDSPPESDSP